MVELFPKISVIGCGNVGMRYTYALMIKGIARKIVLVDLDKKRLGGEVIDLSHSTPFTSPVEVVAGDYSDIKSSDLVVITAGKKQKAGQTRLDVAKDNVDLFRVIVPEIFKYAPSAIYLIVSNPVDILSYATYIFSKKDSKEVIGSGTVLDTARFKFLLGKHCNVDPRNVHAYILGEHGDTEVPIWSKAMLGGGSLKDYCPVCNNHEKCNREVELNKIFEEVRDSAYEIIERKGETSYGIGLSLVRITQALINNENSILPVSCFIDDYIGINDVYLSLPAVLNNEGIRDVLKLDLNKEEQENLRHSAQTLKDVLKAVGLN
ncbi:MAG: L-lactate dehydrogenase [Promethearchaeota archaeon]|jgi:L-lactate dehydrogenase